MFEFIIYLKALATMLITNSNFDAIYPISQLSMGGSIGNSIFFWVSGFCLSNIKSRGSIVVDGGAWYLHRLWRIYLPCVVAVLINTFYRYMIHIATPNLKEILGNIVNPTVGFWFVQAILVLYILYFSLLFTLKKLFLFIISFICLKTLRVFLLKLNIKQLFLKLLILWSKSH